MNCNKLNVRCDMKLLVSYERAYSDAITMVETGTGER